MKYGLVLMLGMLMSLQSRADIITHEDLVLLGALVDTNTSTENTTGLEKARQLLIPEFESIGMFAQSIALEKNHRVLVFETKNAKPSILLLGHLDTVFGPHSSFQKMEVKNGKIKGPGVIDMKGGIVLMLDLLKQIKLTGGLNQVRVILNDDEEIGSIYSKSKLEELSKNIPYLLVFEPGLPDGSVVTSESGVSWVKLTVKGKAAHAGLDPRKGVNACVELANKIVRIAKLTNYRKDLNVNVGLIMGGSKPNVVCDEVSTTIDIRYRTKADLEHVMKAFEKIRSHMTVYNSELKESPTAELSEVASLPPLTNPRSVVLFGKLKQTAAAQGTSVQGQHVGYASDANHLAGADHQVLVGLGPYGGGMHTDQEYMDVESYQERFNLNLAFIQTLLKENKVQ